MNRPHIVILGAGFGGMHVARRLSRLAKHRLIDLTIVNRTNYFLFTPLLHEVATGGLNPRSVAEPLREIFAKKRGIDIVQGKIDSIDTEKRIVKIAGASDVCTISYDYLVVATGAETNYYGIPGAEHYAQPLKSLNDAVNIRTKVIDAFERAVLAKDHTKRRKMLSFAVVGGGATGVEVTGELAEFIRGLIKRYYNDTDCRPDEPGHCRAEEASITLIHTGRELLEMFTPSLRKSAAMRLKRDGVEIRFSSTVKEITHEGLRLSDGSFVDAETVIWAAGVKAVIPHFEKGTPALSGGRIIVDQYLRLQGSDRVFVLGDTAAYVDVENFTKDSKNTRAVPMLAQVAVQESKIVVANILASIKRRPLRNFHFRSKGSMVSIGQWFAIGEIYSIKMSGRVTWWIWRTIYLFKFVSWRKRLRIVIDWTLDFFYPRDITKLI